MSADKLILDSLGAIVAQKRNRFEALGAMNVNGLSEVERMQGSMQYSQAQAELRNAENDLRMELERRQNGQPK